MLLEDTLQIQRNYAGRFRIVLPMCFPANRMHKTKLQSKSNQAVKTHI